MTRPVLPTACLIIACLANIGVSQSEEAPNLLAEQVSVSNQGLVELHVDSAPLSLVLRMLSVKSRRNIVAMPSVSGTVTADLYGVTLEEALEAILKANNAGFRQEGKFIYVHSLEEIAQYEADDTTQQARVFRLNYIKAAHAQELVTPLLSATGVISSSTPPVIGITPSDADAGGNSLSDQDYLLVYDYVPNLDVIAKVIEELDRRPRMVLVEATILRAQLTDENALGIDFTVVGGVDLELLSAVSTGISDLTLGALPTARLEKFNANATTDFAGNVPRGGLSIGIIKDHVGLFIRALEQITDTTVLANPKVLALNKQRAQVIVGRRDGYLTTTVTATSAVQTVEFLETGTQLIFRPFIADDYVRLELHPEDSIGGLTAANLPFEQTTEVTTNVIVRDGQTIFIGGLFREVTTDTRSQLPILGNIPLIGNVFRSRVDDVRREEIIILLTVHIVKDMDLYARAGDELFDDIERMRVGLRKGQQWHGRESLARVWYNRAVDDLATGNDTRALWHLRGTLNNNPHHHAAIRLREKLLQKRDWDDEGSATRLFLRKLVRAEQGITEPEFDRPDPLTNLDSDADHPIAAEPTDSEENP